MISQLSVLTHQIEGRAYHFLCAPDSPLHEIQQSLATFINQIAQIEANGKASKIEETPKEVNNVES